MAQLSKSKYGENSMKGVGLVVSIYDNATFETKNGKEGVYAIPRIHPDDERAVGQIVPELRSEPSKDGKGRPQTGIAFYGNQLADLKENSETFPLLDVDGNEVGTNYVTRADLRVQPARGNSAAYLIPNFTKDGTPFTKDTNLSVEPDVLDRSFALRKEAKEAKAAIDAAKGEATAEPVVDDAAAKRSAAAKKAAATRKANKEAAQAASDEPSLG